MKALGCTAWVPERGGALGGVQKPDAGGLWVPAVAQEVKVADLLGDNAQPRAGAEGLYLWAEDLAEGHILEVQGCLVGDGCADPLRSGGGGRRAGQRVCHHLSCTWQIPQLVGVLGDESQVALLAARGRRRDSVQDENQRFVIHPQFEWAGGPRAASGSV